MVGGRKLGNVMMKPKLNDLKPSAWHRRLASRGDLLRSHVRSSQ
jgi:hypothetical protein